MYAVDKNNNRYIVGSSKSLKESITDKSHQVYVIKNDELLASIDLDDSPRKGIKEMINYFDYNYPMPSSKAEPFKPSITVAPTLPARSDAPITAIDFGRNKNSRLRMLIEMEYHRPGTPGC